MFKLLAFLVLVGAPLGASAQLPTGQWNASLVTPKGDSHDLKLMVRGRGDSLRIQIARPDGVLDLDHPQLRADTLRFGIPDANGSVTCTLMRQSNGTFNGQCTTPDGNSGRFTMTPPTTGASPPAEHPSERGMMDRPLFVKRSPTPTMPGALERWQCDVSPLVVQPSRARGVRPSPTASDSN